MLAALGEPGEVVGIMDCARLDRMAGGPGEGSVTGSTPHLVAPIDFAYHFTAGWTGFRVLPQQSGGGQIVGGTGMGGVLVQPFDLEAIGTDPDVTDAALPDTGQEPVTVRSSTTTNELGNRSSSRRRGVRFPSFRPTHLDIVDFATNCPSLFLNDIEFRIELLFDLGVGLIKFALFFFQVTDSQLSFGGQLVAWQETLFTID